MLRDFAKLETFLTVVREKSFSKASAKLGISQPAVTQQMKYIEEYRDLFTMPNSYHFAHCIASDLGMGAGIAVPMQKSFGLRGKILNTGLPLQHPTVIKTDRIFNLIRIDDNNAVYETHRKCGVVDMS